MKIFTKEQIEKAIEIPSLISAIEQGLMCYSQKLTKTAKSSFLNFEKPPGDVHIKSGAILDDDFYVVKIASGFYDNPKVNLPSSNGLMLLFSQKTGALDAILLDEGRLTDLRTGLAGAISAKHLANPITKIGIIGTGTQAREQLSNLQYITDCRDVLLWGRDKAKATNLAQESGLAMFNISLAKDIEEITEKCNLIVTTTTSSKALLYGNMIKPGTHITAVGTDDIGKQELDSSVFEQSDLIIVDSFVQCSQYGDLAHIKDITGKNVMELGTFLNSPVKREPHWITVADLTGVAVEDLQIAKAIYAKLK